MAGIFGAVGDVSQDELEEMSHRLRHRGPIARTVRMSDRVYLGCIGCNEVDSFFTDGRFVVVGDIHIYNRDELKQHLATDREAVVTGANLATHLATLGVGV